MAEPARFMQRGLHRGAADASLRGERIDRIITDTITLDLKGDDSQDSPLSLGVVVPQAVRQFSGTAEHPPAIARRLSISRSLTLSGDEPAYHPTVDPTELGGVAGERVTP
jgi:hypothetical protein